VTSIIQVAEDKLTWAEYVEQGSDGTPSGVRFKALTARGTDAPPMQYVEYAAGHADHVHRHDTGEVFIVTEGTFSVDDTVSGPGAVVYVPKDTDYALIAGGDGVRFFRIVVP
jgi:quercetin dioxygenase-like cupin family protein